MPDQSWRESAAAQVTAMCSVSYKKCNPVPGKKHRRYPVPVLATGLIECLNTDNADLAHAILVILDAYPSLASA